MRRSNHENIDVLMLIGLVTEGEGEEGGGKSNSKVGTRWVRQKELAQSDIPVKRKIQKTIRKYHISGRVLILAFDFSPSAVRMLSIPSYQFSA